MAQTRSELASIKAKELKKQFDAYKGKTLKEIKKLTGMEFKAVYSSAVGSKTYETTVLAHDHEFHVMCTIYNKALVAVFINSDFVGKPYKDEVVVRCYYHTHLFDTLTKAKRFYQECAAWSDGSELERYTNILQDLASGKQYASDGVQ